MNLQSRFRKRGQAQAMGRLPSPWKLKEPTTDEQGTVMRDRCLEPRKKCLKPFRDGLDWTKVQQNGLTNCPLLGILAAIARVCPDYIRGMIIHDLSRWYKSILEPPNSRTKKKFQGTNVIYVKFPAISHTVIISPRLYHIQRRDNRYSLVFGFSRDGSGWVSYAEKAYVKLRGKNHYENLGMHSNQNRNADHPDAVSVQQVFFDLVGQFTQIEFGTNEILSNLSRKITDQGLKQFQTVTPPKRATRKNLLTILNKVDTHPTIATTEHPRTLQFSEHTYVVTGLINAHGKTVGITVREMMKGTTAEVPIRNLGNEFDTILQSEKSCKKLRELLRRQ